MLNRGNLSKITVLLCGWLTLLVGCSTPESQLADVSQAVRTLVLEAQRLEEYNTNDALTLYEKAAELLRDFEANHPDIPLAKENLSDVDSNTPLSLVDISTKVVPSLQNKLRAEHHPLACAEYLLPTITDIRQQISFSLEIAKRYRENYKPEFARQRLRNGLLGLENITFPETKVNLLSQHALEYAKLGLKNKALELAFRALSLAKQIQLGKEQETALTIVAETYVRLGIETKAFEALQSVSNRSARVDTLRNLEKILLHEGLYSQALSLTAIEYSVDNRIKLLLELAEEVQRNTQGDEPAIFLDYAFELASVIQNDANKTNTLVQLAKLYRKIGNIVRAEQILDAALLTIDEKNAASVKTLSKIALEFAALNQLPKTASTITQATQIATKLTDRNVQEQLQVILAVTHGRTGSLDKARTLIKSIKSTYYKSRALLELASEELNNNNREVARELLNEVRELLSTMSRDDRLTLLTSLRSLALKAGAILDALAYQEEIVSLGIIRKKDILEYHKLLLEHGALEPALELAKNTEDPYLRAVLIAELAEARGNDADPEELANFLDSALSEALASSDESRNLAIVEYFADLFLKLRWPERTLQLIESQSTLGSSAAWQIRIAKAFAERQDKDAGKAALARAVQSIATIESSSEKVRLLIEASDVYSRAGITPGEDTTKVLREMVRLKRS